jgi:hypothetical protein
MSTTIEYAYRRFVTERFPLPTEAQVEVLEQRLKVTFRDDYRQFVLEFNGGYLTEPEIEPVGEGCPLDGLTFLCGIRASHPEAELGRAQRLALFDDNDPPKIMVIGETAMGGLIILDTAPGDDQGEIYYKEAFGEFYYIADGIEEFFGLLREPTTE